MPYAAPTSRRAMLALPGPLAATAGRAQPAWPDRPVWLLIGDPPAGQRVSSAA
jgi:hypothetical protein